MTDSPYDEPARYPVDPGVRRRLAEIAHEINSPLSAVRLQLFLHRKALVEPSQQDLHTLDLLERNVARIQALVASLVSTADGQSGPAPSRPPW